MWVCLLLLAFLYIQSRWRSQWKLLLLYDLSLGLPEFINWQTPHQLRHKETGCIGPVGRGSVLIPLKLHRRTPPLTLISFWDWPSPLTHMALLSVWFPLQSVGHCCYYHSDTPFNKNLLGKTCSQAPSVAGMRGEASTNSTQCNSLILLFYRNPATLSCF